MCRKTLVPLKTCDQQKYTIISSSTPAINFLTVRGLAVLGEWIEKAAEIRLPSPVQTLL